MFRMKLFDALFGRGCCTVSLTRDYGGSADEKRKKKKNFMSAVAKRSCIQDMIERKKEKPI